MSSIEKAKQIPLLRFLFLLPKARINYLFVLRSLRAEMGDSFYFNLPFRSQKKIIFLLNPKHVRHVLKDSQFNYVKSDNYKMMAPLLGQGLLSSDGPLWQAQRKTLAPEFHQSKVVEFHDDLLKIINNRIETWTASVVDISDEMFRISFQVASQIFIGHEILDYADTIMPALKEATERTTQKLLSPLGRFNFLPSYNEFRIQKCVNEINSVILRILQKRPAKSLLSKILNTEKKDEVSLSLARDQIVTFLLAGFETTGLSMTWLWYCLLKNPEVLAKVESEIKSIIGQNSPTSTNLLDLKYTRASIDEALRLYPSVPVISRKALDQDSIDGIEIQKDDFLQLSPWVTHRHPDFWERPDDFMPERFLSDARPTTGSYFPFGLGARECIGKNFAVHEMLLVVVCVMQKFELININSNDIALKPLVTLHANKNLLVRLKRIKPTH